MPRGGPDGGDGGRGGDVVICATARRSTLEHLRGQHLHKARAGDPGLAKGCSGANGDDVIIEVPVGTVVYDANTDDLLADLTVDGARVVLCHGGRGGWGNTHFKTSTNRTPTRSDPGGPPEDRLVRLELKLLADVGLLGFPNAGKSTLISVVSNARPRIADYPFTTLVPNLGVVRRGYDVNFVIADIPGLVAGASDGVGLGHRFLRHVERCRLFLHLVSGVQYGETPEDPLLRYRIIQHELAAFSPKLARRAQIPVLTKADALSPEEIDTLRRRFREEEGLELRVLSSITGEGVADLMDECWIRLSELKDDADFGEDLDDEE